MPVVCCWGWTCFIKAYILYWIVLFLLLAFNIECCLVVLDINIALRKLSIRDLAVIINCFVSLRSLSIFAERLALGSYLGCNWILILVNSGFKCALSLFKFLLCDIHPLKFSNLLLFFLDHFVLALMDRDIDITFLFLSLQNLFRLLRYFLTLCWLLCLTNRNILFIIFSIFLVPLIEIFKWFWRCSIRMSNRRMTLTLQFV